jgi:NitT/TauT family transport system substrate-binding protein
MGAPALAAVLLASACGGGGDDAADDDLTTVDVAISTVSIASSAPFAVAQEQGFFADEGCQIGELLSAQGGATTLRTVLDGGLDMGEVATNAVIDGYLAGSPIVAVGAAHQLPYDNLFAVQPGSGIASVEDMAGRRWAFTNPGSASEDMTYLIPDAAGVPLDSIERVPAGGLGEGLALLESGETDAALTIPTIQARDPEAFEVAFSALDYIDAYQKTVYITRGEFLDENPEAVSCILAGLHQATQFIQDDPAAAAEIYAESAEDFTVEELTEELQLAVESGAFEAGVGFNAEGLANVARAGELQGETADVPWTEIFDPSYLPEGAAADLPEASG